MSDSEDNSDEDFAPNDAPPVPRPAKRAKTEEVGTATARARPVWPPPPPTSMGAPTPADDISSGGGSSSIHSSSSTSQGSSGGDPLGPQVMHGGESLTQPELELVKFYEKLASREDAQRRALRAPLAAAAAAAAAIEGSGATVGPGGHARKPVAPPPPADAAAAPSSAAGATAAAPTELRGPSMLDRITEASESSNSSASSVGSSGGATGTPISASPAPGALKKKKVLRPPGAPGTAAAPARAAVARSGFDRGELHAELPAEFTCWSGEWVGELADDALDIELPHFAEPSDAPASSRCVAVLTCTIPSDSTHFAVNVCPVPHGDGDDVWLHFNPRQFERGGSLVVDYKIGGDWVRHERYTLGPLPQLFGLTNAQLAFHVGSAGIRACINGNLFLQYGYRPQQQPPPQPGSTLAVHVPAIDDKGDPYRWTVHSVWWGPLAQLRGGGGSGGGKLWRSLVWTCGGDVSVGAFGPTSGGGGVVGGSSSGGSSSSGSSGGSSGGGAGLGTTLYVGGLPRLPDGSPGAKKQTAALASLLKAKGCGDVSAVLPSSSRGFAFVRFATAAQAKRALGLLTGASLDGTALKVSVARG